MRPKPIFTLTARLILSALILLPGTAALGQAGSANDDKGTPKAERHKKSGKHKGPYPPGYKGGKSANPDKGLPPGHPHPGVDRPGRGRGPDPSHSRGMGRGAVDAPPGSPQRPDDPAAKAERKKRHLERIRKRRANLDKNTKHKAAFASAKGKKSDIVEEQKKHLRRMSRIRRLMRIASEKRDRDKMTEIRELQKKEMKRHAEIMRQKYPRRDNKNRGDKGKGPSK